MRKMRAMEARAELPAGTCDAWAKETKDIAGLPERAGEPRKQKKR